MFINGKWSLEQFNFLLTYAIVYLKLFSLIADFNGFTASRIISSDKCLPINLVYNAYNWYELLKRFISKPQIECLQLYIILSTSVCYFIILCLSCSYLILLLLAVLIFYNVLDNSSRSKLFICVPFKSPN